MGRFSRYDKAINFLEGLNNLPLAGDYMIDKHHADVYLKRMRFFLDLLGNPDKGMKFIHVAGTSGKGTVTQMLHRVLYLSGKTVGSFTSPQVSVSIEKIAVNDKYIAPDDFADIVEYLKPFIDEAYLNGPYGRPSYFEIFLAIALIYFKKQKCDWVVLEVGLGGRFDATNVIERPFVTAITNIDYDHTEILGKTLKNIAYDKAGIIKRGSTFFTTEQRPTLQKIFSAICSERGVSMNTLSGSNFYQENNKALVTAIAKHLAINERIISKGIDNVHLPGRFEIMQKNPIVIIDGAHNRAKIKSTIDNLGKIKYKKMHLVIGIADNKDHLSILKQIIPKADSVFFTRFGNKDRKCAHPKDLVAKSKRYLRKNTKTSVRLDPEVALSQALDIAKSGDVILVAGSFFLAGELRGRWYPKDWILENRKSF